MSKLRPLHDRVVIRRSEEEKKTAGGIVLPGSAAEKANHGVIVAAGPGKTLETVKYVRWPLKSVTRLYSVLTPAATL